MSKYRSFIVKTNVFSGLILVSGKKSGKLWKFIIWIPGLESHGIVVGPRK